MISSQCDELRDTAMRVEIFLDGSTDAIPMDTHKQLRHAANTIWELRNDCVELRDENAKLRAERDEWHRVAVSKQDIIDHMRDARAENAKLRGLVSSVLVLRHDPVYEWLDARLAEIDGKGFTEQARELGVEAANDD